MAAGVRKTVARVTDRLAQVGVESPEVEAEILVAHVVGVTRSELVLQQKVARNEEEALERLVARREQRGASCSTCLVSGGSGGSA